MSPRAEKQKAELPERQLGYPLHKGTRSFASLPYDRFAFLIVRTMKEQTKYA